MACDVICRQGSSVHRVHDRAAGIEKRLSKLPATHAVYVDLKQKVVAVEAKQGQTLDAKTITAEIVDAGYDVVKLETVEQSVAEIKAAMKAKK